SPVRSAADAFGARRPHLAGHRVTRDRRARVAVTHRVTGRDRVQHAGRLTWRTDGRAAAAPLAVLAAAAVLRHQALSAGAARQIAEHPERRAGTIRTALRPADVGDARLRRICAVGVHEARDATAGGGVADFALRTVE